MRTITVDIINEKVLKLLQTLEQLQLIQLRKDSVDNTNINWLKYKGAMTKQPMNEVEQQLSDLRNEWE